MFPKIVTTKFYAVPTLSLQPKKTTRFKLMLFVCLLAFIYLFIYLFVLFDKVSVCIPDCLRTLVLKTRLTSHSEACLLLSPFFFLSYQYGWYKHPTLGGISPWRFVVIYPPELLRFNQLLHSNMKHNMVPYWYIVSVISFLISISYYLFPLKYTSFHFLKFTIWHIWNQSFMRRHGQ